MRSLPNRKTYQLVSQFLVALAGVLLAFHPAEAGLIYDNGLPRYVPRTNGYEMTGWVQADDFGLTDAARIESVEFGTIEGNGAIFYGLIVWQIYSNSPNNTPGTLLFSGMSTAIHAPTGYVSGSEIEYRNSFSIQPVVLPPGVYWLALHNGPLSFAENKRVYWEASVTIGPRSSYRNSGPAFNGSWVTNAAPDETSTELVFRLNGTFVPRVTSVTSAGGTRQIDFTTTSGQFYRVEYKDEWSESWKTLPDYELVAGNGTTMQAADTSALLNSRRFYRILMF